MRKLAVLLFSSALVLAAPLHADTIHFVGVPTLVNDGAYYVTPYQVTINGVSQLVTCYDTHDDVNFGDTWQANLLTLGQAATTGYFAGANSLSKYERVAWLDAQTYSTPAQQVGLQHAIWQVFGSAAVTHDSAAYAAAADAAAATGFAKFDFSGFRYIEQIGGVSGLTGTKQALVFRQAPIETSVSSLAAPVPEPSTLFLWLVGLALIGFRHYIPGLWRSKARSEEEAVTDNNPKP